MKPSGIVSFYNVPADAEDPDVKVYVNNELVESGGGGSSDLSICTMTIGENYDRNYVLISIPEASDLYNESSVGKSYNTGTYNVILYKGQCIGELGTEGAVVTGNATVDEYGSVTITGDFEVN